MRSILHFAALICAIMAFPAASLGGPAPPEEVNEEKRRAWVRASWADSWPFANSAELDEWLARDDTVRLLRRQGRTAERGPIRARLARALLARGRPADREEALALLAEPAMRQEPEAQFVRARLDLDSEEPARRDAARRDLAGLATFGPVTDEAREVLAAIAHSRLNAAPTPAERQEAIAMLAAAAFDPTSPHRRSLDDAVRVTNGGRPPPSLASPDQRPEPGSALAAVSAALRLQLTGDDYPAAAIRAEETGTIRLRGLIDPAGRLILTEAAVPGQPPNLERGLRRLYAARPLPPVDLGELRSAPYIWVMLPSVAFSLPVD